MPMLLRSLLLLISLLSVTPFADAKGYASSAECEQATHRLCSLFVCDYIPPGKTFEETCGNDWGPWQPNRQPYATAEECESATGRACDQDHLYGCTVCSETRLWWFASDRMAVPTARSSSSSSAAGNPTDDFDSRVPRDVCETYWKEPCISISRCLNENSCGTIRDWIPASKSERSYATKKDCECAAGVSCLYAKCDDAHCGGFSDGWQPAPSVFQTPVASCGSTVSASSAGNSAAMSVGNTNLDLTDVPPGAWYADAVRSLVLAGIVSGYADDAGRATGRFGPADTVTLAQALKMAVLGAGYVPSGYAGGCLLPSDPWYMRYECVSRAEGIRPTIGPVDGCTACTPQARDLAWNVPATRAQVASMVARAFRATANGESTASMYKDVPSNMPEAADIAALSTRGILTGDRDAEGNPTGFFRPMHPINRAEVAKIIAGARETYGEPGMRRE